MSSLSYMFRYVKSFWCEFLLVENSWPCLCSHESPPSSSPPLPLLFPSSSPRPLPLLFPSSSPRPLPFFLSSFPSFFPLAAPLSISASLSVLSNRAVRRPCQMTVAAVLSLCDSMALCTALYAAKLRALARGRSSFLSLTTVGADITQWSCVIYEITLLFSSCVTSLFFSSSSVRSSRPNVQSGSLVWKHCGTKTCFQVLALSLRICWPQSPSVTVGCLTPGWKPQKNTTPTQAQW